jgi:hypothetical protein
MVLRIGACEIGFLRMDASLKNINWRMVGLSKKEKYLHGVL